MNYLKEVFSKKEFLCELVQEHLDEFKGMECDDIMDCFLGEVQVDKKSVFLPFSEENGKFNYGIYFKMISPKLEYPHEIICVLEIREKEDVLRPSEIPACAGLSLLMMLQAKEENEGRNISERCYGFYFYADPSFHLKGTQNKYNLHIRSQNKNLLNNNCCTGIEIYI